MQVMDVKGFGLAGLCLKLYQWIFGVEVQITKRTLDFRGNVSPANYMKNVVRNQKYSILTFIPLVLYNQFKMFFNLFFLIITISQFFPILRIGYTFTYYTPLVFVLVLTGGKEFYDDYQRYKRDKEANSEIYTVVRKNNKREKLASSELKVGDFVQIEKD